METALTVACFVLGLLFGSFANVVIYRVPAKQSVARPRSACPGCHTPISPRDNVPVLSWLVLRGRCRHCRTAISPLYPAVELATGAVFAAIGARIGFDAALPGYLLFAWTLLVLAVIDARTRKIPNRLTYPLTPALLVLLGLAAVLNGEPGAALRALLGGLVAFAALLALALANPRGMGLGDVKLAGFIGVGLGYLGWAHVLAGVFAGFLLGGLVGIALLATRLRGRKDMIPFGPYLAAGALVTVLVGVPIIDGYRGLVGI